MRGYISNNVKRQDEFIFEELDKNTTAKEQPVDQTARMSQILRVVGAIIVVSAATLFLVQRWDEGSDLYRYLLLLTYTGILSVCGIVCGLYLKENKGARTLLGLTLSVTPVNFSVIGGLLYSQFSWDQGQRVVPGYAHWVATSPGWAVIVAMVGLAVLVPLSYLSLLTLNRNNATRFAVVFAVCNLSLWIPTRDPSLIGLLVAVMAFGLCYLECRQLGHTVKNLTFEGTLTRILLWAPMVIMVGRTLHLYSPTTFFVGCLLASVSVLGFFVVPGLIKQERDQKLVQGFSTVIGALAWLHYADVIRLAFDLHASSSIPLVVLPIAVILLGASIVSIGDGIYFRRFAAILTLCGMSLNLLLFPGIGASLLCLGTAVTVLIYGFVIQQKVMFVTGTAGMLFSLGYHLHHALKIYSLFNWGSLAVIGVMIIVMASFLEKQHEQICQLYKKCRTRFHQWDY